MIGRDDSSPSRPEQMSYVEIGQLQIGRICTYGIKQPCRNTVATGLVQIVMILGLMCLSTSGNYTQVEILTGNS